MQRNELVTMFCSCWWHHLRSWIHCWSLKGLDMLKVRLFTPIYTTHNTLLICLSSCHLLTDHNKKKSNQWLAAANVDLHSQNQAASDHWHSISDHVVQQLTLFSVDLLFLQVTCRCTMLLTELLGLTCQCYASFHFPAAAYIIMLQKHTKVEKNIDWIIYNSRHKQICQK